MSLIGMCCDSRWKPFGSLLVPTDTKLKEEDRKYILTDETKEIDGHILHRIQAIRNFGYVEKGDLGGWIESERNLSHLGSCWIADNACVYGDAMIKENANIYVNAHIFEHALISVNAIITGNARVHGNAWVHGNAYVDDNSEIFEQGCVCDFACVIDDAKIYGHAIAIDITRIFGSAKICGDTLISGRASLYKGIIDSSDQYLTAGPIGSRNDFTTFFLTDSDIYVRCGCFRGTIREFEQAIIKRHGETNYARDYFDLIELAKKRFNRRHDL